MTTAKPVAAWLGLAAKSACVVIVPGLSIARLGCDQSHLEQLIVLGLDHACLIASQCHGSIPIRLPISRYACTQAGRAIMLCLA